MACGIGSADDDGETAMQRDKGKYKMIGQNGKIVLSRDSEEEYLKDCGRMMKDANNVLSKKIYKANAETIKKAKDASTGEIKESYERLIALYEGGDEENKPTLHDCVYMAMSQGMWWTPHELRQFILHKFNKPCSESGLTASMRDFRKPEYREKYKLPIGEVLEKKLQQ